MTLFPKFKKIRDGVNVICEQRLLQQVNNLVLNTEVCTGCGICVEACPEEAIALGLVGASSGGGQSSTACPGRHRRGQVLLLWGLRRLVPV